jgi:hypothetical protein
MKTNMLFIIALGLWSFGCTTETREQPMPFGNKTQAPSGFFGRLADQFTERECNVVRFTCPYGFGPAGEPCDCTEPNGVVRKGWTVK